MKHTFNYHEEERDSFLQWVMVHLVGGNREEFDHLETLTDGWKNIDLGITVNGVEMDAKAFLKSLEEIRKASIKREVEWHLKNMPDLTDLDEVISDFTAGVKEKVSQIAEKHGLEIPEEW